MSINRICWQILAITLVLFALVVSLIRGLLPHIPEVRTELVNYLHTEYQLEVQMDQLNAQWQAFGPALSIKNLNLPPQELMPITVISENVHIKLDFWQSVFTLSPQVETVIFDGVSIAINLDQIADGAEHSQSTTNLDWLYGLLLEQLGHFSITDASIQLISRDHDYRPIYIDNLEWQNSQNRHQAQGLVHVDELESKHEQLILKIDLSGDGYQPESIAGQLYVSADSLDLGEWASRQHSAKANLDNIEFQGVINLDAWMTFANRKVRDGMLVFKPSWLQWRDSDTQQKFAIESGVLQWTPEQDGWKLASHDLALSTNDQAWPQLTMAFAARNGEMFGYINQLIPPLLKPMLPLVPDLGLAQVNTWQQLNPQGTIGPIRLYKPPQQPFIVSAEVKQLQWQPYGAVPGLNPIDLTLTWANNQLDFALPQQAYQFDFGDSFSQPLALQGEAINVRIALAQHRLTIDNISLSNADIAIQAGVNIALNDTAHLALAANMDIFDVANAGRYFPLMAMSPALVSYLNGALKSGKVDQAQVLWHGELSGYPYQDHSGVFQAAFTLQDGLFQFQPDWPAVSELTLSALFENALMDLRLDQGLLGNVVVDGARVSIPQLGHTSLLKVEADITADAQAATDVINLSPLKDSVGATLDVVQIKQPIGVKLDLAIPLYRGGQQQIKGLVNLVDNPVYIATPGLELENVSGQVSFVNQLIEAKDITAQLFEQPLTFSVATGKQNEHFALNVDMGGRWDLDNLSSELTNPLTGLYHGELEWDGALTMVFDPSGYSLQVSANSDMLGVALDLPAPYAKAAIEPKKLRADLIGDNKQSSLSIKLGNEVEFWGGFNAENGGQLAFYDVMVGRQFKVGDKLKKQFGHLHLDLPKVELAQWLPLIKRFSAVAEPEVIASSVRDRILTDTEIPSIIAANSAVAIDDTTQAVLPPLVGIHANVAQLNVLGQTFDELQFDAEPTDSAWRFDAISQQFNGRIDLYSNWREQGIKVAAKKLFLSSPKQLTPQNEQLDDIQHASIVMQLPTLAVEVDDFSFDELPLGHLMLQGLPTDQGYQFTTLSLTKPRLSLQANGQWLLKDGADSTEFELKLQAEKFDELSTTLGINPGLKDSPLMLSGNVSWLAAPYHFSLDTLNGQLKFDIGKGYLSEISDKGARVFSLFSLDSLLRKLSLDFSDVFGQGLYFNAFTGNLAIDNGVVKTTDTEMDAIAGNMKVRGFTDLTTQSLNYDIRFVPQLASSVPTVVLLSTSAWTMGLGAFALTKVLEPVIEVISEIRFRVTGTMDNPQLEELERKSKEIEIPEAILPRPDETITDGSQTMPTKEQNIEQQNLTPKAEAPKVDSGVPIASVVTLQGAQYANQLITMPEQPRCSSQPRFYRLAA
ncbi:YhdP family protein [Shewanella inventionis]|uniref:YhdP family protein n=1 Tax=Shewanella inventionis TaxID=1738770 RepID=UPI00166A7399|nr:YhdP family protein [Shewanella inventionis]